MTDTLDANAGVNRTTRVTSALLLGILALAGFGVAGCDSEAAQQGPASSAAAGDAGDTQDAGMSQDPATTMPAATMAAGGTPAEGLPNEGGAASADPES